MPRALASLKYFYEDAPEYHIATAGSLLGIFFTQRHFFSCGQSEYAEIRIDGFFWANNRENIVTFLKSNPTETIFNEILSDLFKQYLDIGGMPEAVADSCEKCVNHSGLLSRNKYKFFAIIHCKSPQKKSLHADL